MWDSGQYLRFTGERARPFADLLARIEADPPALVVDLGCGPGHLTASLAARWPDARVVGVDSSPEMVGKARHAAGGAGFEVVQADLRAWRADAPVDVLVSNATLHWVPGHLDLLGPLVSMLAPGGWLAFQLPASFGQPAHVMLHDLACSDRWRSRVGTLDWPYAHEPAEYLAALAGLGLRADVWETTYLHVLAGEDAVLQWMAGTAARPVLDRLDEQGRDDFLDEYGELLRPAYPREPFGTVLPYRRVFAVARREVPGVQV